MLNPLPEQGGFNERLDEILTAFANGEYSHHWTDNRLVYTKDEAKAAIRTLVLEEIIGEDRPHEEEHSSKVTKMEQRKKLGGTNGTK